MKLTFNLYLITLGAIFLVHCGSNNEKEIYAKDNTAYFSSTFKGIQYYSQNGTYFKFEAPTKAPTSRKERVKASIEQGIESKFQLRLILDKATKSLTLSYLGGGQLDRSVGRLYLSDDEVNHIDWDQSRQGTIEKQIPGRCNYKREGVFSVLSIPEFLKNKSVDDFEISGELRELLANSKDIQFNLKAEFKTETSQYSTKSTPFTFQNIEIDPSDGQKALDLFETKNQENSFLSEVCPQQVESDTSFALADQIDLPIIEITKDKISLKYDADNKNFKQQNGIGPSLYATKDFIENITESFFSSLTSDLSFSWIENPSKLDSWKPENSSFKTEIIKEEQKLIFTSYGRDTSCHFVAQIHVEAVEFNSANLQSEYTLSYNSNSFYQYSSHTLFSFKTTDPPNLEITKESNDNSLDCQLLSYLKSDPVQLPFVFTKQNYAIEGAESNFETENFKIFIGPSRSVDALRRL